MKLISMQQANTSDKAACQNQLSISNAGDGLFTVSWYGLGAEVGDYVYTSKGWGIIENLAKTDVLLRDRNGEKETVKVGLKEVVRDVYVVVKTIENGHNIATVRIQNHEMGKDAPVHFKHPFA